MARREIILIALCTLFVGYIPFASYYLKTNSQPDMFPSILNVAHGQTPDIGSPNQSVGDNSTNISNSTDISSSPSNPSDVTGPNDTSSNPATMVPDVSSDLGNSVANTTASSVPQINQTANQTVPEFGTISLLILTAAIVSIIMISAKIGLRFIPRY